MVVSSYSCMLFIKTFSSLYRRQSIAQYQDHHITLHSTLKIGWYDILVSSERKINTFRKLQPTASEKNAKYIVVVCRYGGSSF